MQFELRFADQPSPHDARRSAGNLQMLVLVPGRHQEIAFDPLNVWTQNCQPDGNRTANRLNGRPTEAII